MQARKILESRLYAMGLDQGVALFTRFGWKQPGIDYSADLMSAISQLNKPAIQV